MYKYFIFGIIIINSVYCTSRNETEENFGSIPLVINTWNFELATIKGIYIIFKS